MTNFEAIVLGVIQGLTEFLPISSSGHLVLFQYLFGYEVHDILFDIAVHIGTLFSILTVYRNEFLKMIGGFRFVSNSNWSWRVPFLIVVGTLPTGLVGVYFKDFFEAMFSNLLAVSSAFAVTGLIVFATQYIPKRQSQKSTTSGLHSLEDLSGVKAFLVGVAQGLAIMPGISRSGTTIAVGLGLGLSAQSAAMFSFMLAVPAILGAAVLKFNEAVWMPGQVINLGVGFGAAYISGVLGLMAVLRLLKAGNLHYFSYYLWLLALVSGALSWLKL